VVQKRIFIAYTGCRGIIPLLAEGEINSNNFFNSQRHRHKTGASFFASRAADIYPPPSDIRRYPLIIGDNWRQPTKTGRITSPFLPAARPLHSSIFCPIYPDAEQQQI
jgi:hypothetical protein